MGPEQVYCGWRFVHDADAHLLEDAAWLRRHANSAVRDRVPLLDLHGLEAEAEAAVAYAAETLTAPSDPAALMQQKNWNARGGFDPRTRSRELDVLGFRSQLVFSTYSHAELMTLDGSMPADLSLADALVEAHNVGMVDFCRHDRRLLPVAFVATHDPRRAVAATERSLAMGCAGVELPSLPQGPLSLAHPAFEGVFAALQDAGAPLLFHVGGGGRLVPPTYAANGSNPAAREADGESVMASLTYMGMAAPVEMCLAALVLGGVFERFPRLQCGVIEQGASWLPGFLRRIDAAASEFGRRAQLARLHLAPSDYCRRQIKVTPFPFEDIRWLIQQTGAGLYLFGSDYPHDEGGETPVEQFAAALDELPAPLQDAVWWGNLEALMGSRLPAALRHPAAKPADQRALALTEPVAVHRKKLLLRLLAREAAGRAGIASSLVERQDVVDSYRLDCGLEDLDAALAWMDAMAVTDEALSRFADDAVLTAKLEAWLRDRIDAELDDHRRVDSARYWTR